MCPTLFLVLAPCSTDGGLLGPEGELRPVLWGALLVPSLGVSTLCLADHHGAAAAGDFPGSAQLPGADYRALQPCE